MEITQPEGEFTSADSRIPLFYKKLFNKIRGGKKYWIAGIAAVVIVGGSVFLMQRAPQAGSRELYTLVPDKISASASITVVLPPETTFVNFDPAHALSFSPTIKGSWEAGTPAQKNVYNFHPKEKLTVGAYHLVTLNTPELRIEKMFSVDSDPSVLAIFPKQEAEVNEYTNITIMFSRPMVALSTLSENADISPPVTISPATSGRFKWITTRTLQFIPDKRLVRSAAYQVRVGEGMHSLDGVALPAFTHTFTTRRLNYATAYPASQPDVTLTHDRPLRIYFNQPIDIERTRSLITLSASSSVPKAFVVSYGTRSVYDDKSGKTLSLTDQSILEVYPESDVHGRKFLWDFDTTLTLTIAGAVPLEGDVKLTVPLSETIHITPVIENISATSLRSDLVTPSFFDPTGTLVFRMSEPIDLKRSNISGKGVARVAYAQTCEAEPAGVETVVDEKDCKKVDDLKGIVVSFDATALSMKETGAVVMSKLTNADGVALIDMPISSFFTTFPKFEIVRVTPADHATGASIKELQICSTDPLVTPSEDEFYKKVHSNMMIGMWDWDSSFLVTPNNYPSTNNCPVNTFQTTIRYGLVPKFTYELTLDLADPFGEALSKTLHFTTEDASPREKNFSHLQPTILMTPPSRTVLSYGLDFMNEMDMTICKVTPETMLASRVFPGGPTEDTSELTCTDRKQKHLILPESYATRKYLQVDVKDYYPQPIGNYVIIFSNPDYRQYSHTWDAVAQKERIVPGAHIYEKTYLTVTNLAVGSKQVERKEDTYRLDNDGVMRDAFMKNKWPTNLYWVNDLKSLSASVGAQVTPYVKKNGAIVKLPSKKTDMQGIAETPSADDVIGAVVSVEGDSAIVSNESDALSYAQSAGPARREYIYADRPIYRPGDTVHIKGISRIGYDAQFEIPSGSTSIEITDAKYETARKQEVHFSNNGTYEFSFILAPKASLGYYAMNSGSGGHGSFQVEEYVAPQFKVELAPNKEEYVSGDNATINVAADYYFGVPVQNGEVEYRIVTQDYYFDRYQDGNFNFGASWYENDNGWYGDRFLTSGKLKLSPLGKGVIAQELNIDKLFAGDYQRQSKIFTVYVTVKNENGQSVTKQQSFIVHRGAFYAGLRMDDYFYATGQSGTVRIKTVDTKGVPVSISGSVLTLNKIDWKSYRRQEVDGNFYYRTERVLTKLSSLNIDTDREGNANAPFVAREPGEYEYTFTSKDEAENIITAHYDLYVSGASAINIKPTNNESLELIAEKTDLKVGESGTFVIKSPYPRAKALVTIARGNTFERKVLDINSQLTRYEFAATERYIPNVTASVLLLSSLPEIKYGEIGYTVGTKEKELDIVITPNKKAYLPGDKVSLDVVVKDSLGKPVKAEISLAVVDMSVLALVGNPKKHPVTFFYDGEPLTIRTAMNVKNILNVAEIPLGTKGGSGGGGNDLEKKKRGIFRDTAYWQGAIETDNDGKANATFTLPDNLTEWQVESVGITKDTKVGAGYSSMISRKTIMAEPLKPRFILAGDSFSVGGTIFNEADTKQRLNVSVTSPTLTLSGEHSVSVSIEPHTSLSVSFPAFAPESRTSGTHEFTLSAKNDEVEDVVTSTFPIERNDTYEFTATAGRITDANWKEQLYLPANIIPDRGGLTISMSATMATILDSAIEQMVIYPYECSEQTASKLRTIALVKENAALFGTSSGMLPEHIRLGNRTYTIDEIVSNGLAKLYQNQSADGGMPYYFGMRPDFNLTLKTLETYIDLKKAGYDVDANKMTQSAQYISNAINYPGQDRLLSADDIIASSYILSKLVEHARYETPGIREKLVTYAKDSTFVHGGLGTPALAYLAILSEQKGFGMLTTSQLFAEFENRSTIDARGTTVGVGARSPAQFFENPIYDTALAIKAFSEAKRNSPLLEGYLRAIKTGKTHDGAWSSTYSTITVIDAMTEYLKWKDEVNANMDIAVTLDKKPLLQSVVTKQNILTTYATSVPMTLLAVGKSTAVEFSKKNLGHQDSAYYYDMLLRYYLPTGSIASRDEGFSVERDLYALDDTDLAHPIDSAAQGQVVHGRVIVRVPKFRSHVAIEDFIPAGTEIVNQRFATEDQGLGSIKPESERYGSKNRDSWWGGLAGVFSAGDNVGPRAGKDGVVSDAMYGERNTTIASLYPSAVENHDDRIFAYIDQLAQGEYVYDYYLRALIPGTYQYLPLVVSELYAPENFGRTKGSTFTVLKKTP